MARQYLTQRQVELARETADELSYRELAEELGVTPHLVRRARQDSSGSSPVVGNEVVRFDVDMDVCARDVAAELGCSKHGVEAAQARGEAAVRLRMPILALLDAGATDDDAIAEVAAMVASGELSMHDDLVSVYRGVAARTGLL